MGFIQIATPAAADEASEALLEEEESAEVAVAVAAAPVRPAPPSAAATLAAAAAAAAPAPASLPASAPTTAVEMDFFGGQSGSGIYCRPASLSTPNPFLFEYFADYFVKNVGKAMGLC